MYYSVKSTHEYIEQHQAEVRSSAIAGFTTSMKTRPLIVAKLEEFIRNKLIKIYSSRTTNEMKTFIWKNGKPQAMKGYNDDLIMALAIGCWVRDTALEVSEKDKEYNKALIDGMYMKKNIMNTAIKGQDGYNQDFETKYKEQLNNRKEFAWIFKG